MHTNRQFPDASVTASKVPGNTSFLACFFPNQREARIMFSGLFLHGMVHACDECISDVYACVLCLYSYGTS